MSGPARQTTRDNARSKIKHNRRLLKKKGRTTEALLNLGVLYFKKGRYPVRSAMGVNGLALGAKVELECMAWKGDD